MNLKPFVYAGIFSLFVTACLVTGQQVAENVEPHNPPDTSSLQEVSTGTITTLEPVIVTGEAQPPGFSAVEQSTPPIKERYQLPQTSHSTDAEHINETVNMVDTGDAVKYFPSLFLRKRNNGDTQAVLQTRTWGLNSSARSLVYADDILLSALIGNNNTNAAPRWGLVSPIQIDRIDFLYGPFSAAYPGNSEGGVMQITTKMPDKLLVDATQTEAFQTFSLYGTKDSYRTDQTAVALGDKHGDVSWLVTGNYQNSYSQPLSFITSTTAPAGTTGAYDAVNKTGAPADVVGAGGLLHTQVTNLNGKLAWDVTPELKATFQTGFFLNNTDSDVQTYLQGPSGNPTYAGLSGFANNNYLLNEQHLANAISFKSDTRDVFDWDFSFSNYYYLHDIQRNPYSASKTGAGFSANGIITNLNGTNWQNGDLKGIIRPFGVDGEHEISFGIHTDRYELNNTTYGTANWTGGGDSTGKQYTASLGATVTEGFWVQDAWRFAPDFKLTLGGRLENWQAMDGYNLATKQDSSGNITSSTTQRQPDLDALRFSPKASLGWTPSPEWELVGSFGQAYRFPTVTELYQIVSTGPTFSVPNPDLKPENDYSAEIALTRKFADGSKVRLSVFNDYVENALISQTGYLSGQTPYTFVTNVNAIRNTGVELDAQKDSVLVEGLDFFGNVTYVNSEILSDPSFASATGSTAEGKKVPYVPDWRVTFGTTYHPDKHWSLTAVLRYSGRQYSTLDNSDTTSGVFGAFDSFLVVDLHAQYKVNDWFYINAGIDNVNNEKYFLYHPFPQRTYSLAVRLQY
ncbi:MAG: TonB-dependent receptor [Verrucomicrobiales bacterium]|nr:TonB-dependent receptor [Verrucomicrobiales bacterium]